MRHARSILPILAVAGLVGTGRPCSVAAQPVAKASFLADGSFSLPSSGQGALERPVAIAWAPSGEVHVGDERGTVAVFGTGGSLVRTYGAGVVRRVAALDVDAEGRAYVLDSDVKSVLVFDGGGELRHVIGSSGSSAGELDRPVDVAVGPGGLVYVLDTGRGGVQVFSLDGTFVHDLFLPQQAGEGRALAVGPSGHVYVAEKDAPGALLRLPPITEALGSFGAPPPTDALPIRAGNVREPAAVVATPTGAVAVADRDSGVLWYLDGAGGTTAGSDDRLYGGRGSGRGSFERLEDIALAGSDELVMLDRDGRKVERISLVLEAERPTGTPLDYPVLFQGAEVELGGGVLAAATRADGSLWFALADGDGRNLRVVEARMVERSGVFGERIRVPEAVGASHAFGQAVERAGAAAMNDTLLVVTEPRRNRFHVFDLRGDASIGSFGDNYSDDRRLRNPRGVALFADGRIALADHGNDRIVVFSADVATLLGAFPLLKAQGVEISPDDRMFAWNEEGTQAGEMQLAGGGILGLSLPVGPVGALTTDAAGNLYVLRRESSRVAILDPTLERLLARVGAEAAVRRGDRITVDADGNIYATDTEAGATAVVRWGVDVDPVARLTATWRAGRADLRWSRVPGSFVTGYVVEGAAAETGPWRAVDAVGGTTARVEDAELLWYRVSPRTSTGAVGRASPAVPVLHLAAAAAFEREAWPEALELADRALARIEGNDQAADPDVRAALSWAGFVAAAEGGSSSDVIAWGERIGGSVPTDRAFAYHRRLSDAYQDAGDLAAASASAEDAVQAADGGGGREADAVALVRRVFENGAEIGRWTDVVEAGEALLAADPEGVDVAFRERLAQGYLEMDDPARALDLVQSALAQGLEGRERRSMVILGFFGSAAMEDWDTALEYAEATGETLPADVFVDFGLTLARVYLATGNLAGAFGEIAYLLEVENDVEELRDPQVARTVLQVYGGFVESGDSVGAAVALDSLTSSLPVELMELRNQIREDAVEIAEVAGTRAKLGEGLQLFQDAQFRDALRFFQAADERTDLNRDQRLIVKEVLAAVLHSLGRLDNADEAYRGVFDVDPDFNLDAHLLHLQVTYGVTVFTEEMVERFRALRPIM